MISNPPPLSQIRRALLVVVTIFLATTFAAIVFVAAQDNGSESGSSAPTVATRPADASVKARVSERFGKLQLSFEVNNGQTDPSVKFLSHGPGYNLFLTATEAVLTLQKPNGPPIENFKGINAKSPVPNAKVREGSVLRLRMIGADAHARIEGQDELPGKVNYLIGNDPDNWRRNIPTYRKVYYHQVYPGIDIVYYGNQQELEYDFVVAPKANPNLIKFSLEGAKQIRLDHTGNLLIGLEQGEVRLNKPFIYQLTAARERREIKGEYVVNGKQIGFKVRAFDSSKPLVIDPVLSYSTFLGSGGNEYAYAIAVDSTGSAYVTGTSDFGAFPTTPGAFKTTSFGGAFVSKLDPTGSSLVYSTYLSGSNGGTTGTAIAVDSSGNAHVTGFTSDTNFPVVNGLKTTGSFFKTTDAALNWNNNTTGISSEVGAIAVAPNAPNTIYAGTVTGPHRSTDGGATWTKTPTTGLSVFPYSISMAVDPTNSSIVYTGLINGGLFKTTDAGNSWSAVGAPLNNASVSAIVFDPSTPSTMYIGSGAGVFKSTDSGFTWAPFNNFGLTFPPNVRSLAIDPTTPTTIYAGTAGSGLFKTTNGGSSWTPLNSGMEGTFAAYVNAIAIDPFNPATIYVGHGFATTGGAINKSTNGGTSWAPVNNGVPNFEVKAMVADRTNASTVYAATMGGGVIKTTNGGTTWTSASAGLWKATVFTIVAHPSNAAVLYAATGGGSSDSDAFVSKLNSSGSALLFSTYLGGSVGDFGYGIAVDGSGNISVVGQTTSANFPVVNAIQSGPSSSDNCGDGFAAKLNPAGPSYVFSTYLRGSGCDAAFSVAMDPSANVYVTGFTGSADFPTANAFQPAKSGSFHADAFVTKLTTTGSLAYSTFLGGGNDDGGYGIAVDFSGNAYITGVTGSSNFPLLNPIQSAHNDFLGDAFVTKLNPQGSALVYSTFLGGADGDVGRGIAVDPTGHAYVTGFTTSQDFPVVAGALRTKSPFFKSINGGGKWSNDNYGIVASNAAFRSTDISNIVVHPTQPSTLYAGTAGGVFKSTNGGRNWSAMNNGLSSVRVVAMVIDPLTPSTLYAATDDFSSTTNGVYKSTDGGNSWNLRKNGMNNTQVLSLAIDPLTPATLYAGTYGGPIFKTTNGADNWTAAGNFSVSFAVSLSIDRQAPATIYAADSMSNGGILKSTDAGATWEKVGFDQTGPHCSFVGVSPHTPGLVYAIAPAGLLKSVDGGNSWTLVRPNFGKPVFDPVSPTTLYLLSNADGVLKSTDNGQTWVPINKGLNVLTATAFAINPINTSILYIATAATHEDDGFVTKINPAGSALIYSTFIGGVRDAGDSLNINDEAFSIAIDSTGNAYISGLARSSTFPTTPNSYQPFNRGFTDAFVAKLAMSYIISGHVLNTVGTPVNGAEVVLNDGGSISSIITEPDGSYQFSHLREGGTFTVSATMPHTTMAPASQTFSNLSSDQTLNFTASISDAPFYEISGQVTNNGAGLAGVTVTLSGSQPGLRTTDSNGNYSFVLAVGGNYTVTPSIVGFTFAPASQTFNSLSAPQVANFTATRQNFVVTNTNSHGTGSLREAILNANATAGADTIVFNIPGPGVKVISVVTNLPEITEQVVIDGTTQPGYAGTPLIELDGTGTGSNGNGLTIRAGGSTVRGLAVGGFNSFGIMVRECDNNIIQANHVGVDATGALKRSNSYGILLSLSSNNLIGGTTPATRNVISGNGFNGIEIGGTGNIVQGNFIGTNAAGTAAIENGISGVSVNSGQFINNVIGGTAPGAGNLISGNQRGISVSAAGIIIQGNLIGTDVTGTKALPNISGISAAGANILIGGLTPGARNIISGNIGDGVAFGGEGSKLQGNYIGTDITGTLPLGNGGSGVVAGTKALVGGTVPEARNVIAASAGLGNISVGSNSSGAGAIIQGNYIGTDVTGTRAMGVTFAGVAISDINNIIGGAEPGAQNVISGNVFGIHLGGFTTATLQGNVIQGNLIGLNATGTAPLPNTHGGIIITDAVNTTVGGTQSGAANKIAFNGGPGVSVSSGTSNAIRGNSIFSNAALGIDLGQAPGVTANDATDSDTGANNLQNFPLITSVLSNGGSTTIQGSLKSTPNTTFQIDFYSSAALDASGNGEGALFFNTTAITTDSNGDAAINATFPAPLPAGRIITATATDPAGNTSEFSAGDATGAAGSLQFNTSFIHVIEDVGLATITVVRKGGTAGNLSVDYATFAGTATAGQDYTSTSGTLNFMSGETSKTFQVAIADDADTEPDETFTIVLSNASNLETLSAPSIQLVNIQDRTTPPVLILGPAAVVEGQPGTSTEALFTLILQAATGRTVSVRYATANSSATGGASCGTQGVDYETTSGFVTFAPGNTSSTIPVKICGDTSAEANETFAVNLTSPFNAILLSSQATGTIINDDVLRLVLEESGPVVNQLAALDALLFTRDPFSIMTIPDYIADWPGGRTRVILFAENLELNPGEPPDLVLVRIINNGQFFSVPAEDVRSVPNSNFAQVRFSLPNGLTSGTCSIFIRAHGLNSNSGTIRIAQ